VVVMTHGRIVEQGDADAIFGCPSHPYTQRLLEALPQVGVQPELAGRAYERSA
jgi:oligopeptide/dipeptide ABC transporter ATP-binding protein